MNAIVSDVTLFKGNRTVVDFHYGQSAYLSVFVLSFSSFHGILPSQFSRQAEQRYLIAVSLAEGETIRRVLHSKQLFLSDKCSIGVHCVESNSCMDVSANYVPSKGRSEMATILFSLFDYLLFF
jgi:hypothetical protein